MEKFSEFITEAKDEPYRLVMFHNSHENLRDVGKEDAPDYLLISKAAKKHKRECPKNSKEISSPCYLEK